MITTYMFYDYIMYMITTYMITTYITTLLWVISTTLFTSLLSLLISAMLRSSLPPDVSELERRFRSSELGNGAAGSDPAEIRRDRRDPGVAG